MRGAQLSALPLARTQSPCLELIELTGTPAFTRPEVVIVGHGGSLGALPGRFAIVAASGFPRAGITQPASNARDPLAHGVSHATASGLAAPGKCAPEGHLIRVFEVAADGEAAREPRDP